MTIQLHQDGPEFNLGVNRRSRAESSALSPGRDSLQYVTGRTLRSQESPWQVFTESCPSQDIKICLLVSTEFQRYALSFHSALWVGVVLIQNSVLGSCDAQVSFNWHRRSEQRAPQTVPEKERQDLGWGNSIVKQISKHFPGRVCKR